jgi:hypothetical protein
VRKKEERGTWSICDYIVHSVHFPRFPDILEKLCCAGWMPSHTRTPRAGVRVEDGRRDKFNPALELVLKANR